ncbi:hypothetical protein ACTQ2N_08685 [Ruminococcus sp. LCP21S3_E8]
MTDYNSVAPLKVPKMRTIKECINEIKELDPHTAVTEYHLRQLTITGVIPRVKAGKKYLVNLDTVLEYLQNPTAEKFKQNNNTAVNSVVNGIRAVY